MDITPIYDLRARLRASAIAGTNLLAEDFRLKRAIEAIAPLEAASPVFAKIGQLSRALIDPSQTDREGVLLDTVTLVDAVLCTQGTVAADFSGAQEQKVVPLPGGACGRTVTNAPYSVVSGLLEALTSSGSGHYSYVLETHEANPELFQDYRVKAALVQALGASYAELADLVESWLKEEDKSLLPLLQKQFDPDGKKEMVRRVRVMECIDPAASNPFFTEQLPDAKKEIRQALIYALRHCPENEPLLWELSKSEKGNARKTVFHALANMESEQAEQYFTKLCHKAPGDAMPYLRYSHTAWAARLLAQELERQLQPFAEKGNVELTKEQGDTLQATVQALTGKAGPEILRAFDRTISLAEKIEKACISGDKKRTFPLRYHNDYRTGNTGSFQEMLAEILHRTLIQTKDRDLCRFAVEAYEKKQSFLQKGEVYFPAAAAARLLSEEDCSGWLSGQLTGLGRPDSRKNALCWAWGGISWNEARQTFTVWDIDVNPEILDGYRMYYEHPVSQDMTGRIADVLIRCQNEKLDAFLERLLRSGDEAFRAKLEDYYYRRALVVSDNRTYLRTLKNIGCSRCEGLAVHYFQKSSSHPVWSVKLFVNTYLPGDGQAKYEEMMKVLSMVENGRLKLQGASDAKEELRLFIEGLKG